MSWLPDTTQRVPLHTAHHLNEQIRRDMEHRVRYFAHNRDLIDERLRELDAEWDIERTLEANAASMTLLGVALGATVSRKFFVLPAVVAGFLLQHALQGWCPPVPIFRRCGYRTEAEIYQEREALKALRGDFASLGNDPASNGHRADEALRAARR